MSFFVSGSRPAWKEVESSLLGDNRTLSLFLDARR